MAKTKAGEKALVHLLVRNDASGPIKSKVMGGRESGREIAFHVACTPTSKIPEFATGEVGSVNCPLCKATADYETLRIAEETGNGSEADLAVAKALAAEEDLAAVEAAGKPDDLIEAENDARDLEVSADAADPAAPAKAESTEKTLATADAGDGCSAC